MKVSGMFGKSHLQSLVLTGVSILLVMSLCAGFGWLDRFEWLVMDWMHRVAVQQEKPLPYFHFIVLDQKSLDAGDEEFGLTWPWPRESYAQVLSFLAKAQAKAVLFDFLFTEPSSYGPEDDRIFGDALKKTSNVYLSMMTKPQGPAGPAQTLIRERPDVFTALHVSDGGRIARNKSLTLHIPEVLMNAKGFGDARFTPDRDGVARRVRPFVQIGDVYLPQIGLAPLVGKNKQIYLKKNEMIWGGRHWPLDSRGNLVLKYPGPWERYPKTSMIDVITSNVALAEGERPTVDPALFKDKIVVIGTTAEGLYDLRKTPLEAKTPGFYIAAALCASALTGRFFNEHWYVPSLWCLIVLLVACGIVAGSCSFSRAIAYLSGILLLYLAVIFWLVLRQSMVMPVIAPLLGFLVAFGASMGISYRQTQLQKQHIRGAFSQVLSDSVLDTLMKHPGRLHAGGELAELSIYFSDLAGFTNVSEKLEPTALVEILNVYLADMVDTIVDDHEGYVDKFIGDAVMAFWGAPIAVEDHALRACYAALENQAKLERMQIRLKNLGLEAPLGMRIGIHTGPAVVGMMGSPKKLNYTIIGDAVNLASRLESVNKQFGTHILASWETIAQVENKIVVREIDRIRVKGKEEPTRIFEVVGLPGQVDKKLSQLIQVYQNATEAFWDRKFSQALALFRKAERIAPEDQPTQIFIKRAERYCKRPPAKKWDGVTVLKSK